MSKVSYQTILDGITDSCSLTQPLASTVRPLPSRAPRVQNNVPVEAVPTEATGSATGSVIDTTQVLDNIVITDSTLTGTVSIDLKKYQDAVSAISLPASRDVVLQSTLSSTKSKPSVDSLLGIDASGNTVYSSGVLGSALLNSSRIIINAKQQYAMLFGEKGVVIASPNRVNIDAGESITLASYGDSETPKSPNGGLFLGLPNRGLRYVTETQAQIGVTKGDRTPDQAYEPLILGLKLANWIEDFLIVLKNAVGVDALSGVKFQPSTQAEFALLANRIPEILSNYAYVDGISHGSVDMAQIEAIKTSLAATPDYVPPESFTGTITGTVVIQNGGNGGTGVQVITKDIKDFDTIVATVIAKLEGGYWHPAMYLNGRLKPDGYYGSSGETMMGIDRYAGSGLRDTPAGKQFWSLIDNAVPPVGTPWIRPGSEYKTINLQSLSGAAQTWEWLYRGGPLEQQLQTLAGQMMKISYDSYTKSYMNPQTSAIVATDGRLMFHFIYACWNGPGWFQKFANDMDKAVANGITNTDELCKVALNSRTKEGLNVGSSPNALIAKGGVKIAVVIGVPIT